MVTPDTPDVIVIGAGLAGCSVAWWLARSHRVLVLEQGAQPGAEASSQNAGMVRRLGENPWERLLARRTVEFLEQPPDDFSEAPPSRRTGAVLGVLDDHGHLNDAVAHCRAAGVRVERCDRPHEVAPALAGSPLAAAWHLPDERVADAHALLTGFLSGLRQSGGEVRCGVRVEAIEIDAGRAVGVKAGGERIAAGAVVLAAGAWSGRIARDLGLSRPLVPLARTLLHSVPHPLSTPAHPWCWIDDVGLYIKPEAGGWLLSGCDEAPAQPPPGPGSAGPVGDMQRALAMHKLQRLLPALADLRLQGGWTGLRTFAPDRRPILGADPELPGLWWAAGLGGFGVTCSAAVGEAVATWIRGQETPWLPPAPVSPGRHFLRRWPIRPDGTLHGAKLIGV